MNYYKKYLKYKKKYLELTKMIGGDDIVIKYYKYIDYKGKNKFDNNNYYKNINPFNLSIILDSENNIFIGAVRTTIYDYILTYDDRKIIEYIERKDKKNTTGEEKDDELIYHNELISPGNSRKCKIKINKDEEETDIERFYGFYDKSKVKNLDPPFGNYGSNFLWNNWDSRITSTNYILINPANFTTIELVINVDNNLLKKYNNQKDKIIKDFHNIVDVRIKKYNELIIVHDHQVHTLYLIRYDKNKNELLIYDIINAKNKTEGNNLTLIFLTNNNNGYDITYLDWFYKNGIKIISVNTYNDEKKEFFIERENGFIGKGNCDEGNIDYPLFSFSTPLVIISETKEEIIWLGVGHIKIKNQETCHYNYNKKLQVFRKNLHDNIYKKYQDKYRPNLGSKSMWSGFSGFEKQSIFNCEGYIYMMYFYKLIKKGNEYKFMLSDAFLPLNYDDEHKDKYKFSLFFPAGLIINNNDVLVSGGEGDYYSIIINFDLEWVNKEIKYDYQTMNINDFNYKVLKYKNNKTEIIDDPSKL